MVFKIIRDPHPSQFGAVTLLFSKALTGNFEGRTGVRETQRSSLPDRSAAPSRKAFPILSGNYTNAH